MGDQKMYVKSSGLLVAENDILRDKCDNLVGITNAYPPIASGLCLLASKKASQPVNPTENRNFSHTKTYPPMFPRRYCQHSFDKNRDCRLLLSVENTPPRARIIFFLGGKTWTASNSSTAQLVWPPLKQEGVKSETIPTRLLLNVTRAIGREGSGERWQWSWKDGAIFSAFALPLLVLLF